MESKENIVFLGMMGSGKTSIGKIVSKKLKKKFIDIDEEIEKNQGMKISEIFAEKGEKFFRNLEEKITLDILKRRNLVIALGGGGFLNKNIRKEILTNHVSFWLSLDSKVIINRIKNSIKRPIVLKLSKIELVNLIKRRSIFYSKALYKVNCNNLKKFEIVDKIINIHETK